MAINFITGLPRQGKTLFTICYVKEKSEKEKRPVYYCNIPEVTLEGWQQLEHPNQWLDQVEDNSLVIIDELQDFWGIAAQGSKVPEPILELSKHGKRGIDFYFITQDPSLVHITPRKLCEWHYHVVRAFGTESARINKFYRIQTNPDQVHKKSEKILWKYNKAAFGKKAKDGSWLEKPWYKSADVHNIKPKMPWQLFAIPLFSISAVGLAYFAYSAFESTVGKAKSNNSSSEQAASPFPGTPQLGSGLALPKSQQSQTAAHVPLSAEDYAKSYQPRLPGFPESAPRYDKVTTPITAPYAAACLQTADRCVCYTQQATRLHNVPSSVCRQIAIYGYFIDWQTAAKTSTD